MAFLVATLLVQFPLHANGLRKRWLLRLSVLNVNGAHTNTQTKNYCLKKMMKMLRDETTYSVVFMLASLFDRTKLSWPAVSAVQLAVRKE